LGKVRRGWDNSLRIRDKNKITKGRYEEEKEKGPSKGGRLKNPNAEGKKKRGSTTGKISETRGAEAVRMKKSGVNESGYLG